MIKRALINRSARLPRALLSLIIITVQLLNTLPGASCLFAQDLSSLRVNNKNALTSEAIKQLDGVLDFIFANHLAVGSVAIQQNGQILYERTLTPDVSGNGKIPDKEPDKENPSFVYTTGSVSKMFTAVMIMQLIEEGKLSLDTKLSKYFSGLPSADSISIEMLLRHRSGLPDYTIDKIESLNQDSLFATVHYDYGRLHTNLGWLLDPIKNPEDSILHMLSHSQVHFRPNASSEYNNSGYWLLAAIIEKCTGSSFDSNLKRRITDRLGLIHTLTAGRLEKMKHNTPLKIRESYYYCGGWQKSADIYLPNVQGAGDILSTPEDLLAFMQGLYHGKLVSAKTLALMDDFHYPDSSHLGQFGLGLESALWPDNDLAAGHSGDTYFNHGGVFYFPKTGYAICCLLNGLSPQFERNDMLDILYHATQNKTLELPFVDKWHPAIREVTPLLGTYYCDRLKMTISLLNDGNTVIVYPKGQDALCTYWTAPDQINQPKYDLNIHFMRDKSAFQLTQHGKTYNFVKQVATKKNQEA